MVAAVPLAVLGAVNVDFTARVSRAPAAGETVADGALSRVPGGKGANQAVAAARLGAAVVMVGAVGDDADGRWVRDSLRSAGIDTAAIATVSEPTGVALITVDAEGENRIVVCPGANLRVPVTPWPLDPSLPLLAQLEVGLPTVTDAVNAAQEFVALNLSPVVELPRRLLERVDLFIVNEGEFQAVPELRDAPLVAVTLGARGAVLLRGGSEVASARAPAAEVVNTVGAGDAFAAALTVGLLSGWGDGDALAAACRVGAAAVADPSSQPRLSLLSSYLA